MVRLPDIPYESWVADQLDLLQKKTAGLFPSLEFRDAASATQNDIPADYPYLGGEDTFYQEQDRIRRLQEEEDRRLEEERRQAEYAQQQTMQAAAQAAQQAQDEQRQQEMALQARKEASGYGIPTPEDALAMFGATSGPPGTGDNLSSTSAFDPSVPSYGPSLDETVDPEAAQYDFRGLSSNTEVTPPGRQPMKTVDDFMAYSSQVQDSGTVGLHGPEDPGPSLRERATDLWNSPSNIPRRAAEAVGRGYSATMEKPTLQSVNELTQSGINAARSLAGSPTISYEDARRRVEERRGRMGILGDSERALEYAKDVGFETVSGTLGSKIAGQLWKEFMPTQIAGVPTVINIGDFEINPGEFLVPNAVGGGANAERIAREIGEGAYKAGVGRAIERGGAAALNAAGRGIQAGAGAVGEVVGPGLRRADQALGGVLDYGMELGSKVADDITSGIRDTFRLPGARPSAEALAEVQTKGVVPLEVRRLTTPEVQLPTNKEEYRRLEQAVAAVGGKIDQEGVHLGVTRAFDPRVTDVRSPRGGVFLEPIPEGGSSGYLAPEKASVGGPAELPRTPTTFRAPLVVESGGMDSHINDAYRKLGVQGEVTPRLSRILGKIHRRQRSELLSELDAADLAAMSLNDPEGYNPLRGLDRDFWMMMQPGRPAQEQIDYLVETINQKFRVGSPKHTEAIREVVRSFGGNPDLIADTAALKNAGGDLGWIINENIISTHGRRQGYDGMLVLEANPYEDLDGAAATLDELISYGSAANGWQIKEIMDFQVSHIPTAVPETPEWQALQNQLNAAEEAMIALYNEYGKRRGLFPEDLSRFHGLDVAIKNTPDLAPRYEALGDKITAIRSQMRKTPQYPEGVRPGYRLHPEVDPAGTGELRGGAQTLEGVKGAISARRLPFSESVREGYRRMFHGGGIGNADVDPAKFDENGMFGPAHYVTTSPQAAEHYFNLSGGGEGSVLRPTDLDDRSILFDASKALPQSDLKKIHLAMERLYGNDPEMADLLQEYGMLANMPREQFPRMNARDFYDELSIELTPPERWRTVAMDGVESQTGDKRLVNELLSEAGFDGVYYRGEPTQLHGGTTTPKHSAVAIFPEKLDALRNGFTGELKGVATSPRVLGEAEMEAVRSLGARTSIGAVTGGATGAAAGDENTTPQERFANAALGAVLGGVGAQKGTMASARLVDNLISQGRLSANILERHPAVPDRVRALFALAAQNLPDDATVQIPDMVGVLSKLAPSVRQELADLLSGPKTAGEIRRILSETAKPASLGEQAKLLIMDLAAGTGVRAARASESAADAATIQGVRVNPLRRLMGSPKAVGEEEVFSPVGIARRVSDPDLTDFVNTIADDLGLPRPAVYVSESSIPQAFATPATNKDAPVSILLTKGLTRLNLDEGEMRALLTHELAHTNETSFGMELLGKAVDAVTSGVRRMAGPSARETAERIIQDESLSAAAPTPSSIPGLNVPRRGVWKDRVLNGPELPEGADTRALNEIQRQYDEAMRLLARSQTPRMKARHQISLMKDAHNVWEKYEAAVSAAKKTISSSPDTTAPARASRTAGAAVPERLPTTPEPLVGDITPAAGPGLDDAFPFGQTNTDTAVPTRAGRAAEPLDTPAPGSAAGVADEIAFDADALPDKLDPQEVMDHADLGRLVNQLSDELAMDPALQAQATKAAVKLMGMPKPRAKHVMSFLQAIGEKRAIPRGVTKEEAAQQWADSFLRKNGWIADPASAGRQGTPEVPTPVNAGRSAEVPASPTRATESGPTRANTVVDDALDAVDEPTDEALAAIGDDIDELTNLPVEEMMGVIGRRQVDKDLLNDPVLSTNTSVQMFAKPTPVGSVRITGAFERIHNFWREKVIPAATDDLAILQGFQNDVAKEYHKQTGRLLPHDVLAAEYKRLDPGRAAEMAVHDRFKPALKVFRKLQLPMEQVNAYLKAYHDMDVAFEKNNLNRTFPGGTTAADAQQTIDDIEKVYKAKLTPAQYKEFEDAVKQVWAFGDYLLEVKWASGLIDGQALNDMRKAYPHYIPTKIINYLNDDTKVGMGKSLSITDNLIREMGYGGTDKEMVQPLAALLADAYATHTAAYKNKVFNAFYDLWDTASNMNLPVTPRGNRINDMVTGIVPDGSSNATPKHAVGVTGFRNGVKAKLLVDKALGDVTIFQAPTTVPILSGLMQAFRSGATSRNPVFLTANMMLDLSNYLIRESARAGGPHKVPLVLTEYVKTAAEFLPLGTMIGAAGGAQAGSDQVNDEDTMMTAAGKIGAGMVGGAFVGAVSERTMGNRVLSDVINRTYRGDMKKFLAEGGGTAGGFFERAALPPEPLRFTFGSGPKKFDLDSVVEALGYRRASKLEQQVDELQRAPIQFGTARDALRFVRDLALLKPVELIGERIELVPRVAAMRLAERRGESLVSAINKGRTTTIDFNKGGTWTRGINQIVPFFNVGIQGTADIVRAAAENPVAFPAMIGLGVVAPIAAMEAINRLDPQTAKDYDDVPDYIKDQGLVIMLPEWMTGVKTPVDAQGNRHPQFFHFRYRNLAPFAILTREFIKRQFFSDADDPQRAAADIILANIEQLSPVGVGSAQEFTSAFMPPAVGTMAQLAFDRDTFRGKRIVSDYADERASPLSKAMAERFGGRASQWEFGTRDVATGYAGMVHGLSDIIAGTDRTTKTSPQEKPIAGGLTGRWIKGAIGGEAERATDQGGWFTHNQLITPSADKLLKQGGVKWRPGPADPEIKDMPLTRVELGEYQRKVNQMVDEVIHEMASDPEWKTMTPGERESIIQRIIARRKRAIQADMLDKVSETDFDKRRDANLVRRGKR